jgi:hypothetical protein
VGTHAHDLGQLPVSPTKVCPEPLGGVETPMAYAAGRLFAPVVEPTRRMRRLIQGSTKSFTPVIPAAVGTAGS